jgi:hypothetical protein
LLKELRRFGANSGLSGQMTIRNKRDLKIPSVPHLIYSLFFDYIYPISSPQKTQRNKFPGDFSKYETFISNIRDHWVENEISLLPSRRSFPSFTRTSLFPSLILSGKQSCHLGERGSI